MRVNMFSEADIRAAMDRHYPGDYGYCTCTWTPGLIDQDFTVDHLIDVLKARTGTNE